MTAAAQQLALFDVAGVAEKCGDWKQFESAGGVVIRYDGTNPKIVPFVLPSGETGTLTQQSQNRLYTPFADADGNLVKIWGRGGNVKNALTAVAAAFQVKQATLHARAKEREAAEARQHEREAVEKLISATLTENEPSGPQRRQRRSADAPPAGEGEKRFFNPFRVDWRATKEFFQIPNWVAVSPLTPLQQIVYSRLLFPLAGEGGFCARFDKELGIVFGLNCGALAKHLGKSERDSTERVVKSLASAAHCLEIYGAQGQTKTLRYLRTPWMSPAWLEACDASNKKSEVAPKTSDKKAEVIEATSNKKSEVTSYQTNQRNKATLNESPAREARATCHPTKTSEGKGTRAKSREGDEEKRKRGAFKVTREAYDDDLWRKLFATLGEPEMHDSGAAWAVRFGMERDTINTILSDFQASGETVESARKWLQAAWNKSPGSQSRAKRK